MLLARILYPVLPLGPGKRIGIWLCGCKRRCPHCANPELQEFDPQKEVPLSQVIAFVRSVFQSKPVDGITISGGEPFEQAGELAGLLEAVTVLTDDILIFSGYRYEQLKERHCSATDQVLDAAGVLVDGEYVDELNNGSPLRGSDNQRMIFLKPELRDRYEAYMERGRLYQNICTQEGVFLLGLHRRGFMEEYRGKIQAAGIAIELQNGQDGVPVENLNR